MSNSLDRTKRCDQKTREGRLAKAKQFLEAADMIATLTDGATDVEDAYITLCVHAGIAAGDAICCARLGEHAQGDDHDGGVRLLERADKKMARHLGTLVRMKTRSGYSAVPSSIAERKQAGRAAEALVEYASGLS
jgi:hypothetical protein